ncbi:hypothetical protein VB10N_38810 [Vibrio sp. 10N]|nr:hypothetical protein VB10N_38810 [Vibrio sp. 10N]
MINPKLRGWANYYRHCVAKQVFGYVGHKLFQRYGTGQLDVIQPSLKTGLFTNISSTEKANGNFMVGRKL